MSSSYDLLDAFERRHGSRQFENEDLPKLTADEKRQFKKALQEKIVELQKEREKVPSKKKDKNLDLSQMTLMWIYDQVTYGKM